MDEASPHLEVNTGPTFLELFDQHQATSRLLEQRGLSETTKAPQPQISSSHDDDGTRPSQEDSIRSKREDTELSSTSVYWKGPPVSTLTWDGLSILLSACFLALGICVAQLEDKPESVWSKHIIQATQITPSIWPIIFSGVLGNTIKALADWRVERGVSLLTLEQLLGSLTMASSIITMFRWSILRISSAVLIVLWAFNPLGSQASLRSVYLHPRNGSSQGLIRFYNNTVMNQVWLSAFNKPNPSGHMPSIVPALYASTLRDPMSRLQYIDVTNQIATALVANLGGDGSAGVEAATDPWGNVRIPNLKYLPGYDSERPHEWLDSSWNKQILNFSSLVGERIEGINRSSTVNSSFTVQSSYQDFSCSPWLYLNTSSLKTGVLPSYSEADWWLSNHTARNLSRSLEFDDEPFSVRPIIISPEIGSQYEHPSGGPSGGPYGGTRFVFGQYRGPQYALSVTRCSPRTTYIDANVTCISKSTLSKTICGVSALRESSNPPANPNMTIFDWSLFGMHGSATFADILIAGLSFGQASSDAEYYMLDPLTAFTAARNGNGRWTDPARFEYADLGSLDITLFEQRFSLLCNTLWKISWLRQSVAGGNMSSVSDDLDNNYLPDMIQNTTSLLTFPLPPTYKVNKPWLTLYFVAVAVMLLAAIVSLVIRSLCCAPPILGYVSSLIRDSTYFEESNTYRNSVESGSEKTKRLGGMKVVVSEVGLGTRGSGKIAFTPLGAGRRVKKRRWYN